MKAFSLDRDELLRRLERLSREAAVTFPEILQVRLFGSLAKGTHTGLSDVDLFLLVERAPRDPIERIKPYFDFFVGRLGMAVDVMVATVGELQGLSSFLEGSLLLFDREGGKDQRRANMAKDPGLGYRVIAEVIEVKGKCNAGHEVGERMEISCHNPGGLCGFFYHDLFPTLATFQFGGRMPWWEGDEIVVGCPDPANQVTLRLRREPRN